MPSAVYGEQLDTMLGGNAQARTRCTSPLKYRGSLDQFSYQDVTPVIGREFGELQVVNILKATNRDDLIRDLAVTGMII